jgi:hypothetical protein
MAGFAGMSYPTFLARIVESAEARVATVAPVR